MSGLMPTNIAIEQRKREGASQANLRVRAYLRRYAIQTTGLTNESAILNTPGLPLRWSPHPDDFEAVCIDLHPEQDKENPNIWYVTAEYSTDYILQDFADPVFKLPEVEWDFEDRQVPAYHVLQKIKKKTTFIGDNGQPRTEITTLPFKGMMQNSAGQPFDSPVMIDKTDPVLCIEVIYETFDPIRANLFTNSLNADSFLGADPGQVRCKIRAKRFQWRDVFRVVVNYRFAYRAEGWQPTVLDQGPFYIEASGAQNKIPFTDVDGNPVICLLNGLGENLNPGPTFIGNAEPVFLDAIVYPVTEFAPLQIPQILARVPTLNQQ